jgi:hypothetical protein
MQGYRIKMGQGVERAAQTQESWCGRNRIRGSLAGERQGVNPIAVVQVSGATDVLALLPSVVRRFPILFLSDGQNQAGLQRLVWHLERTPDHS